MMMSRLKNIYGENVTWFCLEGSVTLRDLQVSNGGMIDGEFEVCGEDEKGNEGTVNIDVISLLESASVVIDEQSEKLEQLRKERDELREALASLQRQVIVRAGERHILETSDIKWVSNLLEQIKTNSKV